MNDMSIDSTTLDRLEGLMRDNLASRDAIYAAAARLDGAALRRVCTRFADEHGGNVADLMQLLTVNGRCPVAPGDPIVRLIRSELERELLLGAPKDVIERLTATEQKLITRYASTAETTANPQASSMLKTHSSNLEKAKDTLDAVSETMTLRDDGSSGRGT
jgi:hypothetical protein